MTLQKAIYKITDFDLDTHLDTVIEEFNRKYAGTWCLVDSKPYFINIYEHPYLVILSDGKKDTIIKASKIEAIKPKTGLYKLEHALFYVTKWPLRQWKRSFCEDNHKVFNLDQRNYREFSVEKLINNEYIYAEESIIYKNIVFLHTLAVGLFTNNTIIVYNPNFYDELREIWKQYNLILDTSVQKILPVESSVDHMQ